MLIHYHINSIRDNAEQAVRNLLRSVAVKTKGKSLKAIDHMDDGTPIQLEVSINEAEGSAVFDFEGTGPEVLGNVSVDMVTTLLLEGSDATIASTPVQLPDLGNI